jgi:hypothetical protein
MQNNNNMNTTALSTFSKNLNSQFGEDGIIEEVLKRLNDHTQTDGWCVEFGAWDGKYLSNTYNLIQNKNYKAVLIEGDSGKHEELCKNLPSEDVIKICAFVHFSGDSTLDALLKKTPIPQGFDFLSIDIDGCDYYIWESLELYKPKLICIEFNPTIPNEIEFVQSKDFSIKQGASAKSLTKLATSKGYSIISSTICNVFYIRNDLKDFVIGSSDLDLESIRDDAEFKTYIFSGYDGTIFVGPSPLVMPWHGLTVNYKSIQQLPKPLRTFFTDYSLFQKLFFFVYTAFKFPGNLKRRWKQVFP